MSKTHDMKLLRQYFQPVWEGKKTFEIRINDRDYQVGDRIILREYDSGLYCGRSVSGVIEYITDYGQTPGMVVFSFSITQRDVL